MKAEMSPDRAPMALDRSPLIRPNPNISRRSANNLKELLETKPNNRKISSVSGFHQAEICAVKQTVMYSPAMYSLSSAACRMYSTRVEPTTKQLKSEYGDYIRTTRCVNTPKTGSIAVRNPILWPPRPLLDQRRSGSQNNEIFRDNWVSTVKNGR